MSDPPPPHPLPLDILVLALAHWRDALQEAQTDLRDAARSRDWAIADKARTTIDHTARNIGTAINICEYRLNHPNRLKPPGDA